MTEIDIHFNAPDKVRHACRLLRKAVVGAGAKVIVTGEDDLLHALDSALWQFSATDFVPHCRGDAEPHVRARSAATLVARVNDAALSHRDVLVNLGSELPVGFERFERLIDVVGLDDADRQAGRLRWRHYAERGYVMTRHDLQRAG